MTVTEGDTITLTAKASGDTPMTWAWKKGGSAVSGANGTGLTATFTKANAASGDAGEYTCEFTNDAGSKVTNAATVTVNAAPKPPTITTQPTDVTATEGDTISLTAEAEGDTPMTWLWKKDAVEITDATGTGLSATFSKDSSTVDDSGSYTCEFTNSEATTATDAATVTVTASAKPPSVSGQPSDVNATAGETITLTAAAIGDEPMSWHWTKDDADIAGASGDGLSATFTKDNAEVSDSGSYKCVFSNATGNATTNAAIVTINDAAKAPEIVKQPESVTITEGEKLLLSASATGTEPMDWQWKRNGSDAHNADGTGLDATLVKNVSQLAHAGKYTCEFTNSAGTTLTDEAVVTITPKPVPPTISTQPTGITVAEGGPASLTAVAEGDAPMNWIWKKGGVEIEGSDGTGLTATLSKGAVTVDDAGDYSCVFTNDAGTAETDTATITVTSS